MTLLARLTTGFLCLTLMLCGAGLYLHPGIGSPWLQYFDSWLVSIVQFSIWQAFLSAFFSVLIATPIAWFLSRQAFRFQWVLKSLFNLFFIMPTLIIILAVVAAYSDWINVFSLKGILIAHLYINGPFAIRLIWQSLENISQEKYQLGRSIGFNQKQQFYWIELPVLLQAIKPVFLLIFIFCFSSFTIVLTLGGGPANTNLEVAVYQALKLDFDPKAAVLYALIHFLSTASIILLLGKRASFKMEYERLVKHIKPSSNHMQRLIIGVLLLVLLYPVTSLVAQAFSEPWIGSSRLLAALTTSFVIALFSAMLSILLSLGRAFSQQRRLNLLLDYGLNILPVMVITTGLFLLVLKLGIAFKVTHLLIIWVNALMTMPLLVPMLRNRVNVYQQRYAVIATAIGMPLATQFKYIYWPAIRGQIPWSVALAMVLSVGDLGVSAMVGSVNFVTLPILIYQAMGSYQMILASQLTLLLLVICALILLAAEWLGERKAHVKGR
ncbi:ABC transporter permease subunit [Reinekea thalattae]|uniref:ABC transporter permease subunit n=1 Tax=Reinekea thalattae TaxID=2593301 RepID=A0A5C8Z6S7_9GAMM|nr:ABC transporter permease subunit [Reinekea thalattae]TXR53003.1 ABC transporter permease subunit [Reinekea thalattae]